jgi:serine/threonine protein kinase
MRISVKTIGKYEVCGLLGKGGMSKVYKVRLPVIGKIAALKILSPHPDLVAVLGMEGIRQRFIAEAITMARLRHSNIARISDFDEFHGKPYLVMEYYCNNLGGIVGESYRIENRSRVLNPDKAFHYTRQILEGLACLHHAGIIHRDIKPFNILLTDGDTIKISDFGMSKLRGESLRVPSTLLVGSPYYAAPEQEVDPERVDAGADLYSVGIMLYRMVTGFLPAGDWNLPSAHQSYLDLEWDKFLRKATAQNSEDRYASAREMLVKLADLQANWEHRKWEACRAMPGVSVPEPSTTGFGFMPVLRVRSIKVGPRQAQEIFRVDELGRPVQYVTNDFQENRDGTITDRSTGLIWQSAGSEYPVSWEEAHGYIQERNRGAFAGRTNWRLPTVEELMSLLKSTTELEDACIEPVFDQDKPWLWSSDRRSYVAAWYVNVEMGFLSWQDFSCRYFVRAVSSRT